MSEPTSMTSNLRTFTRHQIAPSMDDQEYCLASEANAEIERLKSRFAKACGRATELQGQLEDVITVSDARAGKIEQLRAAVANLADILHECALECTDCDFGNGATGKDSDGNLCEECVHLQLGETLARRVLSGDSSAPDEGHPGIAHDFEKLRLENDRIRKGLYFYAERQHLLSHFSEWNLNSYNVAHHFGISRVEDGQVARTALFGEPRIAVLGDILPDGWIPPSAVETTTNDAEDAAKWRALRNCARVRIMGSAGMNDPLSEVAHIGVEFWTRHPARSTAEAIEAFERFVRIARGSAQETSTGEIGPWNAKNYTQPDGTRKMVPAPLHPLAHLRWICIRCDTVNGTDDRACLGCLKPRYPLTENGSTESK